MRRQPSKAEILSRLRSECRDLQAQLYQSRVGTEAMTCLNEQQNNSLDILQNLLVNGRERLQQILYNQGNVSSFSFEREKMELVYYLQWLLACTIQSDIVSMIRRFPAPACASPLNSALPSGPLGTHTDLETSYPMSASSNETLRSSPPPLNSVMPNLTIAKHPEAHPNSAVVVSSALVMNQDIMTTPRPLPDLVDKLMNLVVNCVDSSQAVERASNARRAKFSQRQQYLRELQAEVTDLRRQKSLREGDSNGALVANTTPTSTTNESPPFRPRRRQPPQLQLVDRHEIRMREPPIPKDFLPSQAPDMQRLQQQLDLQQLHEFQQLQQQQLHDLQQFQQFQPNQFPEIQQLQQLQLQQLQLQQLQEFQQSFEYPAAYSHPPISHAHSPSNSHPSNSHPSNSHLTNSHASNSHHSTSHSADSHAPDFPGTSPLNPVSDSQLECESQPAPAPNDPNIDMVIDSWLNLATPSSTSFLRY